MTLSTAQADAMMNRAKLQGLSATHPLLPKQVVVCGGGNGAHVCAGFLASQGIRVNVLSRQAEKWGDSISVTTGGSSWEKRGTIVGKLNMVSSDPAEVVPGSDVVIIAAPANAHGPLLSKIAPYVDERMAVGALFGQGGFDWAANSAFKGRLDRVKCIFGLQNIPWICKKVEYGRSARIIGPKKMLYLASYPVEEKSAMARVVEVMFDIPCQTLPNFLNLTLTPSNQIIHPARYYGIFRDWDGKRTYSKEDLEAKRGLTLYDEFDEFSAETLTALDNELQQIKLALLQRCPQLDLSRVRPIAVAIVHNYGSDVTDPSSLRSMFCTNRGYKGCATPMEEVEPGRFIPAVNSRLFWEDVPFGLCILKNLAEMLGNFPVPSIEFLIRWHQQFMGKEFLAKDNQLNPIALEDSGAPYKYGIHKLEDLVKTCLPQGLQDYQHPRTRL